MRIVALTVQGYAEQRLIAGLRTRYDLALTVVEDKSLTKLLRHLLTRRDPLLKRLDRAAYFCLYHALIGRLIKPQRKHLRPDAPPYYPDVITQDINSPDLIERVQALHPDLILTSRIGILRRGWFETGIPMINVHPGIAPQYRGLASWMWAVIHKDVENIGVTVHRIMPQVDTGEILAQARLTNLGTLGIEATRAKLDDLMLTCALDALDRIEHGESDPSLPANHSGYKAYLEIGLTDFIQFLWARQQINRR